MSMLLKVLLVFGLLGGSIGGLTRAEEAISQQIRKAETVQARLCSEDRHCDENPISNMIRAMKSVQTRLQEFAGEDNEPQGPNGPYQCSLTCQADEEGCVPCEANGAQGPRGPQGPATGGAAGPNGPGSSRK